MAAILAPTPDNIERLARALTAGELVAIPTETVYGLAGDARSDAVVEAIYEAKARPAANPLIAHYPELGVMAGDVRLDERARRLAGRFWPGPLTLVLPRRAGSVICERASAGLPTLAVRCPAHPVARALLVACGFPLVAPSANPSGRLSPVEAIHVERLLGDRITWILDGGPARRGLESTILDLSESEPLLLREGVIPREALEEVVGPLSDLARTADRLSGSPGPRAPGAAFRHYAPACPLYLGISGTRRTGDALLAFGPVTPPPGFDSVINLSPCGDLEEAAAGLFSALHQLETAGCRRIYVMPIPERGVGRALNDRLRRAAAASLS